MPGAHDLGMAIFSKICKYLFWAPKAPFSCALTQFLIPPLARDTKGRWEICLGVPLTVHFGYMGQNCNLWL